MSILLLLIFLIFNIANSTLYNFKKGSEYEKIYSNYIQELNDNNQFECSGRYFYHNYKNRTIDSNLFSGIIIRNDRDSISKGSYLIDFDEKIFYYNNYKSYIYNKDNKTIQYDRAINSIKRIKREIDVDWNIFYDFIDKSQNSIDKKLDTNTNNKFLYDSDEIDHSFIYNKYMDKYGFNWIIREKFTKNNYYPTYYYMNINGYTKLPRFEEWLIDDFEMKKDVDTSKINFDKYINQYPIYEEFAYKRKACTFNDKLEGNLVFDENLKKSRLKLVAFYQDSENLNSKLLESFLLIIVIALSLTSAMECEKIKFNLLSFILLSIFLGIKFNLFLNSFEIPPKKENVRLSFWLFPKVSLMLLISNLKILFVSKFSVIANNFFDWISSTEKILLISILLLLTLSINLKLSKLIESK